MPKLPKWCYASVISEDQIGRVDYGEKGYYPILNDDGTPMGIIVKKQRKGGEKVSTG